MALILSGDGLTINYAGRSYQDLRNDFMTLAERDAPQWTDRSSFDPGVLLGGYQSRLGQFLGFYINRRAEENYSATMQLMSSARNLGKLFSYTPAQPTTATVDVMVVTKSAGPIPRLFAVSSDPSADQAPVRYELLDAFNAPAAGQYVLTFHHGETREEVLIGRATGFPFQEVTVTDTPIATNADGYPEFQLDVMEGAEWRRWTRVANFLRSSAGSRHYTAVYNDRGQLVVSCGDGVTGKIWPVSTSALNLRATYRVGGGPEGARPGRGTVRTVAATKGCTIVSSVINLREPSGGKPAETLAEVKKNLPLAAAARDSIVQFQDAVAEMKNSGLGVTRVKLAKGTGPYDIVVTVAAAGGNPRPSGYWDPFTQSGQGLLGAVGGFIAARCTESWILRVIPAVPVPIICRVVLTCASWAYRRDVEKRAKAAIAGFLNADKQEFGGRVKITEFGKLLEDLEGVDSADVLQFHRIPRAVFQHGQDVVTFSGYSIAEHVRDEVWTIRFLDTVRFKVIGSKSGEQQTLGVVTGARPYATDNGALSFRATAAQGTPPGVGTTYTMRTSEYVGNVTADSQEIITNGSTMISLVGGIA